MIQSRFRYQSRIPIEYSSLKVDEAGRDRQPWFLMCFILFSIMNIMDFDEFNNQMMYLSIMILSSRMEVENDHGTQVNFTFHRSIEIWRKKCLQRWCNVPKNSLALEPPTKTLGKSYKMRRNWFVFVTVNTPNSWQASGLRHTRRNLMCPSPSQKIDHRVTRLL